MGKHTIKRGTGDKAIANFVRRNYPWILAEAEKSETERMQQHSQRIRALLRQSQIAKTREKIAALQAKLVEMESGRAASNGQHAHQPDAVTAA